MVDRRQVDVTALNAQVEEGKRLKSAEQAAERQV
jgi:hypothetical protein